MQEFIVLPSSLRICLHGRVMSLQARADFRLDCDYADSVGVETRKDLSANHERIGRAWSKSYFVKFCIEFNRNMI